MRIEICGGIASGKTSFARLFKGSEIKPVFETFRANPFWRKFLSSPLRYSFETEVSFLLHHSYQIKQAAQRSHHQICDFSVFLDLAYAQVTSPRTRLKVFRTVWAEIVRELALPALVVHLQCDARTELARIRARGRAEEASMNLGYLERLNEAVRWEVARTGKRVRTITVNSAECDFVSDRRAKQRLKKSVLEEFDGARR